MKRIGLVLSGSGFLDGSEIQETVLTLLCLARAAQAGGLGGQTQSPSRLQGSPSHQVKASIIEVRAFAPDTNQWDVIDHFTKKPQDLLRNVLHESARIVRGKIEPLKAALSSDLDGLIIPGGYGAAKNLCSFARDGAAMKVDPDLETLLKTMHHAGKPLGAICIAPVLFGKVFASHQPRLTVGGDREVGAILEGWGATVIQKDVDDIVVDEVNRLVTTPAFMLDRSLDLIEKGIAKLVQEILRIA